MGQGFRALVLGALLVTPLVTKAALVDRGHGMVYDDVLDVTWLQDANYARTSGYHSDGLMTRHDAITWASSLSYGGFDDWRLPRTSPVNGSAFNYAESYDGSTDDAYNIGGPGSAYPDSTASELAYMYFRNLNNVAFCTVGGACNQPGSGLTSASFIDGQSGLTVSFANMQNYVYWIETPYGPNPGHPATGWAFTAYGGGQRGVDENEPYYAWAVRDGDVSAVPVPAAAWLLLSGLAGLGFLGKLRKTA